MGNSHNSQGGLNGGSVIDFINSAQSATSNNQMQQSTIKQTHVMTTFTWTLGGNTVFVTGTFTNWTSHIPLQRDGHIFTTTVELQRGQHHYKFIVDGEWRFSPEDPTKPDAQGNINNFIDTSNYQGLSKNVMSGRMSGRISDSKETSVMIEPKRDKLLVSFEQFDQTAKKLPSLFTTCSYLDAKDNYSKYRNSSKPVIKESSSIDIECVNGSIDKPLDVTKLSKGNLLDIFDSPHSLAPPTHVVLNHVSVKKSDRNFNVYSMTHRFKSKYTTYKFYTHQRKASNSTEI